MAARTELTCINLCSGYGGFELGFRLAGINARTVAHVERDAYAAATLVARMEEQNLDQAPIWDDLTTFDSGPWRGRVDCITAGFPCQPFSAAGSNLGIDDDRWLWPAIERIIRGVGPRFVFLENVPGLVRGGLSFVLADLAQLGFDAEWGLHSAAEVGAPHKRERFWLLADADRIGRSPGDRPGAGSSGRWSHSEGNSEQLADTSGARFDQHVSGISGQTGGRTGSPGGRSELADTSSFGIHETWGDDRGDCNQEKGSRPTGDALPVDSHQLWPPTRNGNWAEYIAEGGPQPAIRRSSDGPPPGLADSLHLGGNGLVPQVAAAAFLELLRRHRD